METPEFFQEGYYTTQFTPADKRISDSKNGENFIIDDLLDYPNDDNNNVMVTDEVMVENISTNNVTAGSGGASTDSSTVTAFDTSCNSSFSGTTTDPHHVVLAGDIGVSRDLSDGHFGSELCVPYDDLAELEWLSNFVEESFSSEDLHKMQLLSGVKARTETSSAVVHPNYHQADEAQRVIPTPIFRPEVSVPGKARSKRSRAAPCNWTSRLLAVSSPPHKNPSNTTSFTTTTTTTVTAAPPTMSLSSSSESELGSDKKTVKHTVTGFSTPTIRKKEKPESGGEGRRCLHCMIDKTPQWRTGPMGPKTLCNACGVRYKSGRLVPEYRPAASPTFTLAKHSNSHRKVLEIRRQKELQQAQNQQQQLVQQGMMFDINGDDYLIHQHIGPDFRQLI